MMNEFMDSNKALYSKNPLKPDSLYIETTSIPNLTYGPKSIIPIKITRIWKFVSL